MLIIRNQCWTDIMPFYEGESYCIYAVKQALTPAAREDRCGDLAEDIDMSGRPGMGGGMGTSDNSTSASASITGSPSSSAAGGAAATSEAAPSSSPSASATQSGSASVSADNAATSSPNAAAALVPAWGAAPVVLGAIAAFGFMAGGALVL